MSRVSQKAAAAARGVGKPKTRGRVGLGHVVLTAGEIRPNYKLLINLGEDDENEFMEARGEESICIYHLQWRSPIYSTIVGHERRS